MDIFRLTQEYVHDHLGEFALEVIGTCVLQGGVSQAVAVQYLPADTKALEAKIVEKRDCFAFLGNLLSGMHVEDPDSYSKPSEVSIFF